MHRLSLRKNELSAVMKVQTQQVKTLETNTGFYERVGQALATPDVEDKLASVDQLIKEYSQGLLLREYDASCFPAASAGFPQRPVMVDPADLPRRSFHHDAGRAAFLHAIAHIEFNAINLALDAAYRFRQFPEAYYADWLNVAAEEVKHFRLITTRLADFDCEYGDLPAHRGLWDMCEKTQDDPLARMALVPRYLEAKGLDVTPGMITKLTALKDDASVAVLSVILEDEVGHVRIGSRWFAYLCKERQRDPVETYFEVLGVKLDVRHHGPFNHALRKAAGFSERELDMLEQLAASGSVTTKKS